MPKILIIVMQQRALWRLLLAAVVMAAPLSGCTSSVKTVIDDGYGPVLCTTVRESSPPQCDGGSPIEGWNWSNVTHEESNGVRWGNYSFTATRSGDTVTVVGSVEAVS